MRSIVITGLLISLLFFQAKKIQAQSDVRQDGQIIRLEKLISRLMSEGDVPGLSIALIRDGKIFWHKDFGVKNIETKEPVDESAVFEAASLSKPVFAYAVLKLVDDRKLDLDTPLVKYLSEPYLKTDERANLITARMVLSHTTGFPNEASPQSPLKIYFQPGEHFSYSGEGFLYLQKVVERITNLPLDEFMKRAVFESFGMTSSSYVWQEKYEKLKANGHTPFSGAVSPVRKPTVAKAYATLHTTVLDYAKFVAALKGSGLKKETMRQMLKPQIAVNENCVNCLGSVPSKLSDSVFWGLGWGLERTANGEAFWHWGDNSNEFHNFVIAYPKTKTAVIIFTDSGNGHSIIPEIVAEAGGGAHPAFAWIRYEPYNSPAKFYTETF